jgi:pimeloyl-ACP methyl ester carboxylesterase
LEGTNKVKYFTLRKSAAVIAFAFSGHADAQPAPATLPLSTGSELAVWTITPDTPTHITPIIFLHGGPGMYTEARRFDEGQIFRDAGFTTMYFDQAGGGKSKRLPANAYSLERAVNDLEALRIEIKQEKLILWGNSYGATLAAVYAARYPGQVAAVILTSPGTFPGTNPKRNYRLTNRDRVKFSRALSTAAAKIDKDGAAAEKAVTQAEAGALLDEAIAAELIEGMVCKGTQIPQPALSGGGNLFANRIILKQVEKLKFASTPIVIPALVVRGSCDFLGAENAAQFATLFSASSIVVNNSGHALLENRTEVDAALREFTKAKLAVVP